MKKRVAALVLVFVMALSLCVPAFAANVRTVWTDITYRGISIVINGIQISPCDEKGNSTEPFIMNDTTYLPVRAIAGALGLNVGWEPSTSTVVLESGGEANYGSGNPTASFNVKHVEITYRGTKISLDGENIPLVNRNGQSVEPFIYNGSNYLPLRVVSEALGLSVGWDGATSTITLKSGDQTEEPKPEEPKPPVPANKAWMPKEVVYSGGKTGSALSRLLSVSYSYDSYGRLVAMKSSDGQIDFSCSYDEQGRISDASYKVPGVNESYRWAYDEEGNIAAYFVNGNIEEGYYSVTDEQGRLVREFSVNEGMAVRREYEYDAQGLVSAMTELKDGTSISYEYSYDEAGRVSEELRHEPGNDYVKKYSYSEDGLSCRIKEYNLLYEDVMMEYTKDFDAQGRIIGEAKFYPDNAAAMERHEYEYDSEGRVALMRSGSDGYENHWEKGQVVVPFSYLAETRYTYSELGMPLSEVTENYTSRLDYYGEIERQLSGTNEHIYSYDSKGRLTKEYFRYVGTIPGDKSYRENFWVYDSQDRLTSYQYSPDGSVMENWVCEYDGAGNITYESYVKKSVGQVQESYEQRTSYNSKGNPVTVNYSDNTGLKITEQYNYNHLGQMVSYTTDQNGAKSISTVSYDSNGMPVRTETKSYTLGLTVVSDMSYVEVPSIEEDAVLAVLLGQIALKIDNMV